MTGEGCTCGLDVKTLVQQALEGRLESCPVHDQGRAQSDSRLPRDPLAAGLEAALNAADRQE